MKCPVRIVINECGFAGTSSLFFFLWVGGLNGAIGFLINIFMQNKLFTCDVYLFSCYCDVVAITQIFTYRKKKLVLEMRCLFH